MTEHTYTLGAGKDAQPLFVRKAEIAPTKEKGVAIVIHGMDEYGERYCHFAEPLNKIGISAWIPDLRGHGHSVAPGMPLYYFADVDGWKKTCSDIVFLISEIRKSHPGKKVFLFGHSMGSFITRTVLSMPGGKVDGAILCGTAQHNAIKRIWGPFAMGLAVPKRKRRNFVWAAKMLTTGNYNARFGKKGGFEWLAADMSLEETWADNELCGGPSTGGLIQDMIGGLMNCCSPKQARKVPANTPLLLISGCNDPVGDFGKAVNRAAKLYRNAGVKSVKTVLVPGARHNIFNDSMRDEFFKEITSFLAKLL